MRTGKKPNFGKNKKLVRTLTASIAILIAATLMLGGAISAIGIQDNSTKMNKSKENEIQGDPTGLDPKWTENTMMASSLMNPMAQPLSGGPLAERMYGYVAYGAGSGHPLGPCHWELNDPGTITSLQSHSGYWLAGGTWTCDEIWYGCEWNTGGLIILDPETGDRTTIGGGGTVCNGLAWDPVYNRLYGAASTGLYEYDPETGGQDFIATFNGGGVSGKTIIAMAFDLEGTAYIWDVLFSGNAHLWTVDVATAECTEVADMGENLLYAQDGSFDWLTGTLWLSAYSSQGFLAYWDFDAEELVHIDNFEGGAEITCSMLMEDCVPPEHDVGVKQILKPVASGHAVPEMEMELLVKNYGNNTETFDAQMEIIKCESSGDYLLEEHFDGDTFPPENWTTDYWDKSYTNYASGESPEARAYRGNYGGQTYDNYIMTSPVDATGWEKVLMKFRWGFQQYLNYGQYCNFYVKYRKNDTSPWKDVSPWENPLVNDDEGDLYTIDCYGFGSDLGDQFQVMFQFVGYYYYFNYFWLDDITIEGCGGCAEYAQVVEDLTLDAGEEMVVTFPGWPPSEWQNESFEDTWEEYPVHGFTMMDGDQRPKNNDKWKLLELYYPWFYDIEITEIGSPQEARSMPAQTFDVEATITNVGQFELCCIPIDITIGAPVVLDTVFTENDWPYGSPPNYYLYYPGYGSGWTDEHKELVYYYGWRWYNGANSGGDAPEAQLYYYYAREDYVFYSAAFDTSEYESLQLNFLSNIVHYSGQGLYALEAGYSHDGENWFAAWHEEPGSSGSYEVSVPIEGGSETTYIGFWIKGNNFNFRYWYIDNVEVVVVDLIEEYTDTMCQGDDLIPGESRVFEFDDWTPDFLAEETTAWEVPYKAQASIEVEGDQDPGNNIVVNDFELDYWHDPALEEEVTSPNDGGRQEVLWENGEPDGRNGLGGSYYYGYDNRLIDDFTLDADSTVTGGDFSFMWNSGSGTGTLETVKVFFYEETGDCEPSMDEYAELEVNSFEEELTGDTYFGRPEIVVTVEFDDVELPAGDWWVGFQPDSFGEDLGYMLTAEDKGCGLLGDTPYWGYPRWSTCQQMYGLADMDLAFALTGFSSGPPGINVYIQPGTESIDAVAINHGTFNELDLTCYAEIWEYITEPENGTLQYEDEVTDIDLDTPLGGTENLAFNDFTFADEGRYGLYLEMPTPDDDEDDKNNKVRWGVGVDDTEPESEHALDPPDATGLNGWYISDVEVALDAEDPLSNDVSSDVKEIKYKVGTGSWQTITGDSGTFVIHDDGDDIPIEYYAIDNVGNAESPHNIFTIDMDQTVPDIDLEYEWEGTSAPYNFIFTANATDAMSDMDYVEFYLNGELQDTVVGPGPTYVWSLLYVPIPNAIFRAIAYDMAGLNAFDDEIDPKSSHNNQQSQSSSSNPLINRILTLPTQR